MLSPHSPKTWIEIVLRIVNFVNLTWSPIFIVGHSLITHVVIHLMLLLKRLAASTTIHSIMLNLIFARDGEQRFGLSRWVDANTLLTVLLLVFHLILVSLHGIQGSSDILTKYVFL